MNNKLNFSKQKLAVKMKLFTNFSTMIPTRIINDTMDGEIRDFYDTFNTSGSQSVCSASKSGD